MEGFEIVPIETRHLRKQFRCGCSVLDNLLANYARQNHDRGTSTTFVAANGRIVLGFATYLRSELEVDGETHPALKLAKLAVDSQRQRLGVGHQLVEHVYQAARALGLAFVLVDAKVCTNAPDYYQKLGFDRAPHVLQVAECETMMRRVP